MLEVSDAVLVSTSCSTSHVRWDSLIPGILLGINQLSPNVFNEVHIVLASNEVGVFSLELSSSAIPSPLPSSSGGGNAAIMGREELRMEDLLQAQFENELNLLAFEGMATFSINMLIHQINKSESDGTNYQMLSGINS